MAYYMEPTKKVFDEEETMRKLVQKNNSGVDDVFHVKSIKLANLLMEKYGFKLLKVEPNPDNPRYQLFSFENTEELQKVVNDYIKESREAMFDFGVGIHKLKVGEKITRKGWAKKQVYLCLVPADENNKIGSYIGIRTGFGTITPFVASAIDLLAEDWVNYNENRKDDVAHD